MMTFWTLIMNRIWTLSFGLWIMNRKKKKNIMGYSSGSNSDNEEDINDDGSKEREEGKTTTIAWKRGGWKLDPRLLNGTPLSSHRILSKQ